MSDLSLRDVLTKTLDFIDKCAGEGIHFTEYDGHCLDAGYIVLELMEATGVVDDNEWVDAVVGALTLLNGSAGNE